MPELIPSAYTYDQGRIILNDAFSGESIFNGLIATELSGTTIFSGYTNLGDIITNISGAEGDKTRVQDGTNIVTGGTDNYPTVNLTDTVAVGNVIFAPALSGDTIYSGGTNLGDVIVSIQGSPPGGNHASVQYNSEDVFSGDTDFTWDGSALKVVGTVSASTIANSSREWLTVTYGTTINWDFNLGYNAVMTFGAGDVTTFNLTNVADGDYGTIKFVQDGVGGRTTVLPSGSKVANGGGGSVTLTSNLNAIDILSFVYNLTDATFYWNISYDYT